MPDISGLQVLKSLNKDPLVIFITAYSEFALESFNFNVVDYLLKPIEFDRFLKAANKAYKSFLPKNIESLNGEKNTNKNEYLHLKSNKTVYKTLIKDIQYIESIGNYVQVYTIDKKITTYFSLNQIIELLPKDKFLRIHKTFIINLDYLDQYEKYRVKIGSKILPIGTTYRQHFNQRLK